MDHTSIVPWSRIDHSVPPPAVTVAFCTKVLRDATDGQCGCAGDIALDETMYLGQQEKVRRGLESFQP